MNNTDKQPWPFTSEFVEVDYPLDPPFDPEEYNYIDVRPVEVDSDMIYCNEPFETLLLEHDGDDASVADAIKEIFGVTIKWRPDLGTIVAEVVEGI